MTRKRWCRQFESKEVLVEVYVNRDLLKEALQYRRSGGEMRPLKLLLLVCVLVSFIYPGEPKKEAPLYGLYTWGNELNKNLELIKDTGFRIICMPLDESDTEKGYKCAVKNNIEVAGMLVCNGFVNKNMDLKGWRELVNKSLRRFGPNGSFWAENKDLPPRPVRFYIIGGEPGTELKPPGEMMPDEAYYLMLKAASEEIRGYDKAAKIVAMSPIGAFSGALSRDTVNTKQKIMGPYAFIRGVHKYGGAALYDCIDVHPFTHPMPPDVGGVQEIFKWLKEETKKNGGEKPIWCTEMGFPLSYGMANPFFFTKDQAADNFVRFLALCARHGVQTVTLTYPEDQYSVSGRYKGYGIYSLNGKMRVAAKAIKLMTDLLPDPELLSVISDGQTPNPEPVKCSYEPYKDSPYFCYKFKGRNNSEVIIAWTSGKPFSYEIEGLKEKNVVLYNRELLGGVVCAVKDNKIKIPISNVPIFISNEVTDQLIKNTENYLKVGKDIKWAPIYGAED